MPESSRPHEPAVAQPCGLPAAGAVGAANKTGLLRRLRRDQSGSIGMMFGLLVIPITAFVGLAVDFGRVYSVNSHTQAALDAAALAAGRVAQVEKTDTLGKASAAATAYFDKAKPANVVSSALQFSPNALQTEFTVTATSWVRTPFLGVIYALVKKGADPGAPAGCEGNHYGCLKVTSTATAALCPSQICTGSGGTNFEVSLMLDVTGSMSGQKLVDLKAAAKDLIDIVIWEDQSDYTSKIALAPFSQAVNAGTYFTAVTGLASDPDPDGDGYTYPSSCYNNQGKLKSSCKNKSQYKNKVYSKCVVERTTSASNDDAPAAGKYLKSFDVVEGDDLTNSGGNNDCLPSNATIVPLTSDRTKLKDMVNSFVAQGLTAGHLGTAWAWYLLSPKWSDIWPDGSKPKAYGTDKLKKVAVLMTDGEYNTQYPSSNTGSTSQARTLCTNMKKKDSASDPNIEIYTVGFDLGGNNTAITTLKQCATSTQHFCEATTGDQLKACFRDIALKIAQLRLTN